jgi:hypothetical protein
MREDRSCQWRACRMRSPAWKPLRHCGGLAALSGKVSQWLIDPLRVRLCCVNGGAFGRVARRFDVTGLENWMCCQGLSCVFV